MNGPRSENDHSDTTTARAHLVHRVGGGFAWTSVGARCTIRRIVESHGYFWPNPSGDLVGQVGDPLGYRAGLGLKHPHRVWTRDKHCGST